MPRCCGEKSGGGSKRRKDLIVIFDELFKGTNVKDAYDATLAVTEAFSKYRNCFFIISTHIIEVGENYGEDAITCSLPICYRYGRHGAPVHL